MIFRSAADLPRREERLQIERTHRLTGMPKEEIVRRGIVRGEIPIYGLGGVVGIEAMLKGLNRDPDKDEPKS